VDDGALRELEALGVCIVSVVKLVKKMVLGDFVEKFPEGGPCGLHL
jgi:hypothetical protein